MRYMITKVFLLITVFMNAGYNQANAADTKRSAAD